MPDSAELEASSQYRGKRIANRSSCVIRSSQISSPIKFTEKQLTERRNYLLCKRLKDGLLIGPEYHISTAEIPSYTIRSKDNLQIFESRESWPLSRLLPDIPLENRVIPDCPPGHPYAVQTRLPQAPVSLVPHRSSVCG